MSRSTLSWRRASCDVQGTFRIGLASRVSDVSGTSSTWMPELRRLDRLLSTAPASLAARTKCTASATRATP